MSSASRSLERVCAAARWTESDARVVIDEFRASGLSAQEFGRRNGVHPVRVLRWAARLTVGEALTPTSPLFLPVQVAAIAAAHVEIALGARVLRIPAGLDEREVVRLVRAVESA